MTTPEKPEAGIPVSAEVLGTVYGNVRRQIDSLRRRLDRVTETAEDKLSDNPTTTAFRRAKTATASLQALALGVAGTAILTNTGEYQDAFNQVANHPQAQYFWHELAKVNLGNAWNSFWPIAKSTYQSLQNIHPLLTYFFCGTVAVASGLARKGLNRAIEEQNTETRDARTKYAIELHAISGRAIDSLSGVEGFLEQQLKGSGSNLVPMPEKPPEQPAA